MLAPHSRLESITEAPKGHSWLARIVGMICVHLTGVVVVGGALALLLIGFDHIRWIVAMHQSWGEPSMFVQELMIHGVLSAFLWLLCYLTISAVGGEPGLRQPALRKARGTAITETLIVLPILLLLLLGTAQLAVNNLAMMLINYGTSQAARTVWVWQPEVNPLNEAEETRMGVDQRRVEEMARLQVAAAMTPVAPSVFAANREFDSQQFAQMRAIFLASQLTTASEDSGASVIGDARDLDTFEAADRLTFRNALDGATFPRRTVQKFTSAYNATEIEIVDEDPNIGIEVTYMHQITFPLMGPVFGETTTVGHASGWYLDLVRTANYRAQRPPNARLPRQ